MPRAAPPKVSYTSALSHASADKRVDILRRVARSGSISQAAREAGVSYKAAWQAIDTLTNLAGVALVEKAVGGSGGGGAAVTPAGLQLLAAAEQLDQARRQVLDRLQQGGASPPALAGLSVRTSMRNQMPCTVAALQGHGQIVQVQLRLADAASATSATPGTPLVARITAESAQLLGLAPGLPLLALCKATAVTVRRAGAADAPSPPNRLAGRATRVSRGAAGDEVSAQLDMGPQLVGFAPPGSGLRAGSRVWLAMDESALVLALPG